MNKVIIGITYITIAIAIYIHPFFIVYEYADLYSMSSLAFAIIGVKKIKEGLKIEKE